MYWRCCRWLAVVNANSKRRGTRPVLDPPSAHGVFRRRAQLGGGGGGVGACSWVGVGVVACSVGRARATECWPSEMAASRSRSSNCSRADYYRERPRQYLGKESQSRGR